jgi:hypothetical protein
MKQIQPIQIWVSGQEQTASWLGAYIINDNLSDSAQFYWWISENGSDADHSGATLTSGNLTISGESYIDWNNQIDINEGAYEWIAMQLKLTLIYIYAI